MDTAIYVLTIAVKALAVTVTIAAFVLTGAKLKFAENEDGRVRAVTWLVRMVPHLLFANLTAFLMVPNAHRVVAWLSSLNPFA